MKNTTIYEFLHGVNDSIKHLELQDLRAEKLKEVLLTKQSHLSIRNLISVTIDLKNPPSSGPELFQFMEDIDFALIVTSTYLLNKSYMISIPDKYSEDKAIRQNNITEMIKKLIDGNFI